jgi:hypothetical protein
MSIAAVSLAETALGSLSSRKVKSSKAPNRRQYLVKSDAAVVPEPR